MYSIFSTCSSIVEVFLHNVSNIWIWVYFLCSSLFSSGCFAKITRPCLSVVACESVNLLQQHILTMSLHKNCNLDMTIQVHCQIQQSLQICHSWPLLESSWCQYLHQLLSECFSGKSCINSVRHLNLCASAVTVKMSTFQPKNVALRKNNLAC